jgi:hypothetical protein
VEREVALRTAGVIGAEVVTKPVTLAPPARPQRETATRPPRENAAVGVSRQATASADADEDQASTRA